MYWGSGGIAPRIRDLGTRWRWVVSFTPWPLYFRGKGHWYPWNRRVDGAQSRSGRGGEEKIFHYCRCRELNRCRPASKPTVLPESIRISFSVEWNELIIMYGELGSAVRKWLWSILISARVLSYRNWGKLRKRQWKLVFGRNSNGAPPVCYPVAFYPESSLHPNNMKLMQLNYKSIMRD
jgi:hypothetical protein